MGVHDEGHHSESEGSAISKRCLALAQGAAARCRSHGKAELTKTTGVAGEKGDMVALAKARDVAIREDHQGEFKRMIEEARKADADPLAKLEREIGDLRRFKLEEIADFLAERGHPNPFITEPEPIEPVTLVTLQDAWELKTPI
jgi:hypothetical protein